MESQRYINYSKKRHGSAITFIIPSWIDRNREPNTEAEIAWLDAMESAEKIYFNMVLGFMHKGITAEPSKELLSPQQARDVLPNATKTELIMTGFAIDWKRLLRLRLFEETGKVHPDMKVLMEKLKVECIKSEIWDDIINSGCKEI